MFLIIDNTEEDAVIFNFWLNNKFIQRIVQAKNHKNILLCLEKALTSLRLTKKDLAGLGVVVGTGRFTPVRMATTAANTLAFALNIPVVALPKGFDEKSAIKKIRSARPGTYAMPVYSGEARVG